MPDVEVVVQGTADRGPSVQRLGLWRPSLSVCGARRGQTLVAAFPKMVIPGSGPDDEALIGFRLDSGFDNDVDFCLNEAEEITRELAVAYRTHWRASSGLQVEDAQELYDPRCDGLKIRLSLPRGMMACEYAVGVEVEDINADCASRGIDHAVQDSVPSGTNSIDIPLVLYRTRECPPLKPPRTTPGAVVPLEYTFRGKDSTTDREKMLYFKGTVQVLDARYRQVFTGRSAWSIGGSSHAIDWEVQTDKDGNVTVVQNPGAGRGESRSEVIRPQIEGATPFGSKLFHRAAREAGLTSVTGWGLAKRYTFQMPAVRGLQERTAYYVELVKCTIRLEGTVTDEQRRETPLSGIVARHLPSAEVDKNGGVVVTGIIATGEEQHCRELRAGPDAIPVCSIDLLPDDTPCDLGSF